MVARVVPRSLVVALAALLTLAAGTLAAAPTFHDKIDETIPLDDFCGFVGTLRVTGTQVVTENPDGSFKVVGRVTQVFTTADGKTVTILNAGQITGSATENLDGTFTSVITFKGLPEKISGAGGGTLVRDAGIISFIETFDPATGDVTTEVVIRGPHPEAESDFQLFCQAVTAALA